jgi:hypothetical protein
LILEKEFVLLTLLLKVSVGEWGFLFSTFIRPIIKRRCFACLIHFRSQENGGMQQFLEFYKTGVKNWGKGWVQLFLCF